VTRVSDPDGTFTCAEPGYCGLRPVWTQFSLSGFRHRRASGGVTTFVVIPNVSHYVFLSDESEVVSLITRFVNGLPAR
jgi:hypothetical protein